MNTLTAEAIMTVSAAVVAATQITKWAFLPDKHGPFAVLVLAAFGVLMYYISYTSGFTRADVWPLFASWVAVATSAAGVFGFTRAASEAVVSLRMPPPGAAQNTTDKVV